MYSYYPASEKWHTLVHVCRRWRNLVFTSPRHLNLQLLCKPPRSVEEMLHIWPELPIYIQGFNNLARVAGDNLTAALKLNHRVTRIQLERTSDSAWKTIAPLMQHPFPILAHLWIQPFNPVQNAIQSFLGGSAPSLRDLVLIGVPFLASPELLLSTTNLVRLWYDDIPRSGYILPQAMVTGLSALTRLESFSLTFLSPHSLQDRPIRIPHTHTRTLLPALSYLRFRGSVEYIEELVAQIDAPLLESMIITLFHQGALEVSQLAKFVRRADMLSLLDRAEVAFRSSCISVTFSRELPIDPKTLMLYLWCDESDLRLSYLAQFCSSCLPTLFPFECLHIHAPRHYTWQDVTVMDNQDSQWLELLRHFSAVKHLHLSKLIASRVAQALRGLSAGRVMELLPALEAIFISDLVGPVMEAISGFADARQLSGHPVFISDSQGRFTTC